MKQILLITSKSICYNSTFYFMNELKYAFTQLQYEVTLFSFDPHQIEPFIQLSKNKYEAVIDFNSTLPRFCDENGVPYLDYFAAPFYDYILDHPLYHHDMLKIPLKNYHVICLDEEHKCYIQTYYPHIKDVRCMPLFAMPSSTLPDFSIPFRTRPYDLLFTGTYTPLPVAERLIAQAAPDIKKEYLALIEIRKNNLALTMEDAMDLYVHQLGISLSKEQFSNFVHAYYPVDFYMSAYVRDMVIRYLLLHNIPITVAGHGWDMFTAEHTPLLTYLGEFTYENSLTLFAKSKISLNIMPGFTNGSHDRVYNSMLHKSVCCTDETNFLKQEFMQEKDILFYSLPSIQNGDKTLANLLSKYLMDSSIETNLLKLECIAENGYTHMLNQHMAVQQVRELFVVE